MNLKCELQIKNKYLYFIINDITFKKQQFKIQYKRRKLIIGQSKMVKFGDSIKSINNGVKYQGLGGTQVYQ